MFSLAFSWLGAATPVWLSLCLMAAFGTLAWQLRAIIQRIDRHAESIAHMDEWADTIDQSLQRIEDRSRRFAPLASAPPAMTDARKWWQK